MTAALPVAHFANLDFVTPQLAVGGDLDPFNDRLAARQLDELSELWFTHIVDARSEWSDEASVAHAAPDVRYLHHGMDDAGQRVPAAWFELAVGWVENAWADDPDAVVLTHCHMGINRGPSLGFAVLLSLGWEPVAAINALRSVRPQANVWYAADALHWHHARTGVSTSTAREQQDALAAWRAAHPLDLVRLVRDGRERQAQRAEALGAAVLTR